MDAQAGIVGRAGFGVDIVVVRCDENVTWLNDWVTNAERQGGWHVGNVFVYEKCCQMPVEVSYSSNTGAIDNSGNKASRSPERDAFNDLEAFVTRAQTNVRSF